MPTGQCYNGSNNVVLEWAQMKWRKKKEERESSELFH